MRVIFERVDERRYRIGAIRDGRYDVGSDVVVRPAPGPAAVPHDLLHFVVEEQTRLPLGIFGQVAAGGEVGGFFRTAPDLRSPARDRKRSVRIGRAGRPDVATSERLAALVDATGRVSGHLEDLVPPRTAAGLRRRLDEVLAQWRATPAGGRLVLVWPDELTIRHGVLPTR